MITSKEINIVYDQFKKDLGIKDRMPKLLILSKPISGSVAQIKRVLPEFAELHINDVLYHNQLHKEYIYQILYHEFTHIVDELSYFDDKKDKDKWERYLFPYTEFHASQVEMIKCLDLFADPLKEININTKIHYVNKIISLEEFLLIEEEEFKAHCEKLNELKSKEYLCKIIFSIAYSIGRCSLLRNYDINANLPIERYYSFLEEDMEQLYNILLNNAPSVLICIKSSTIAAGIVEKIMLHINE